MIIAVNARHLIQGQIEGIGRFAQETLKIITRDHPEHQFVFIFDRKFSDEFIFSENIIPVVAFPPARHPFLWYAFFEYAIPGVLKKYQPDLFYSPDGWLSLRTPVKSLPVIHDLNFFHYPDFIPYTVRKYYQSFFPRFIKKAGRIATVSEYTARDIQRLFQVSENKIDIVYNGASGFLPKEPEVKRQVMETYTGGHPYFISIGLIHPRKNLTNLFKAYDIFRKNVQSDVRLVVAGAKKWWTKDMQDAYDQCLYHDDILFTGRIPDDELKNLLASALGLVYVSWFEGFGLPVLEAMQCDVPVICSSVSSLPEVGGDAVIYARPEDPDSICSAMAQLYKDPKLREQLITKSRMRREMFTWEKTARLLWESMDKSMNESYK